MLIINIYDLFQLVLSISADPINWSIILKVCKCSDQLVFHRAEWRSGSVLGPYPFMHISLCSKGHPEVRGSKPRSAKHFFLTFDTILLWCMGLHNIGSKLIYSHQIKFVYIFSLKIGVNLSDPCNLRLPGPGIEPGTFRSSV